MLGWIGDSEEISYVPIEGDRTYYIKVEGNKSNDYDSQNNYTLRAKWKEKVDKDAYENNDDFDEAQSIFILEKDDDSNKETINANLHNSYDEDYYLIELESDASVKITLKDIPEYCDYDLKLYDDNEDKLAFSTNNDDDDECIKMDLKKGDYYVRVYGGFSDEEYELAVSATVNENIGDSNNSFDDAKELFNLEWEESYDNRYIEETIKDKSDEDFYKFEIDAFAKLEIKWKEVPRGCDYDFEVYDSDENKIEFDENSKKARVFPAGIYYIKISAEDDYSNENYELRVTAKTPLLSEFTESDGVYPLKNITEYSSITIYNEDEDRVETYNRHERTVEYTRKVLFNEYGIGHGPLVTATGMRPKDMDSKMDRFCKTYYSWTPEERDDFKDFFFSGIIEVSPLDEVWDTIDAGKTWIDTGDIPKWYIISMLAPEIIATGMKKGEKIALKKAQEVIELEAPSKSFIKKTIDDLIGGAGKLTWGMFDDFPKVTKVVNGKTKTYAQVGDSLFTVHALERMAPATDEVIAQLTKKYTKIAINDGLEVGSKKFNKFIADNVKPRNIPTSVVVDAAKNVPGIPSKSMAGCFEHITNDVKVITNEIGAIITVYAQ